MKDAILGVVVALAVVVVVLALIGWGYQSGHESREKNLRQFQTCVENDGTYVKTYGGEPLCLRAGVVAE